MCSPSKTVIFGYNKFKLPLSSVLDPVVSLQHDLILLGSYSDASLIDSFLSPRFLYFQMKFI